MQKSGNNTTLEREKALAELLRLELGETSAVDVGDDVSE